MLHPYSAIAKIGLQFIRIAMKLADREMPSPSLRSIFVLAGLNDGLLEAAI
jgi:hypothetical protein